VNLSKSMDLQKSHHALERKTLMELAARHRAERAMALVGVHDGWECERGHAWDDGISAAQNVRCMNCASQRREQRTARLRAIAEERGGRLVSAEYVDAVTPLEWECAFGHSWDALPDAVTRRWCVECANKGMYDSAMFIEPSGR
jgi:hypothetical protein